MWMFSSKQQQEMFPYTLSPFWPDHSVCALCRSGWHRFSMTGMTVLNGDHWNKQHGTSKGGYNNLWIT